jgi:transcription-repair coupling factor (superfamily II helicase)
MREAAPAGLERLAAVIGTDPGFRVLCDRLSGESPTGPLMIAGLWGSCAPILAALAARQVGRTFLYATAHLDQADEARDDIEPFCPGVEILLAHDVWPVQRGQVDDTSGARLRLVRRLEAGEALSVVAPVQALMQPVPAAGVLEQGGLFLRVGQEQSLDQLAAWCVDQGLTRLEWVEAPGDFAIRGGIVDIFAHDHEEPVRIELCDQRVESIRLYDLSTGRSQRVLDTVRISGPAALGAAGPDGGQPFLALLPADALIFWKEPLEITELGRVYQDRLSDHRGLFPVERVLGHAGPRWQIYIDRFGGVPMPEGDVHRFAVNSVERFEGRAVKAAQSLVELAAEKSVTVCCENAAEAARLRELLQDAAGGVPESIELADGFLHHGFEWCPANRVFVGHHEVFHRIRRQRKIRKAYASRPLETWLDLAPGDHVVHVIHGIARFSGLAPMRKGDSAKTEEFLTLEFADRATLHVPVSQIELVHKYIGAGGVAPVLSKLGGTRWRRTKEKVSEAVGEFAGELLRIQAIRQARPGIRYPEKTAWLREFEGEFEFTETEDQLKVLDEIYGDMCSTRPMDRLVCGDVGYGKTELAMRAAFKAVEYGKQVAVLVPTTVLAEQHYRTFSSRMADYPFEIGCLSRFRSRAEQTRLVQAARKGQVDVLIGTHRLLSKDVGFKDLGLLIIDEEQRFGVEHKERLKTFREEVDVLTLTATPIPRTLHLSLLGVRDISALTTPPLDRRSIVTQVRTRDNGLIREAILRELNRDGQVFFVHNRVHDIRAVAEEVHSLVPEAGVVVGHGQMSGDELEDVMIRFIQGQAQVLVCTSIIESGIDIPSANTMFIDRADWFGLADLHQLRGRVGRYRNRAYCYLLLPPGRPLRPLAARRLKAVEEFSELGAGFKIAMRDLEIRGAGNILGTEQSGHIAAVGYEMYCQLLEQSARRLKGEPQRAPEGVHLELGLTALLPKSYIRSDAARMEVYRRLAGCAQVEEVRQLEQDLADAYGRYPQQVQSLIEQAEIRALARGWGLKTIIAQPPDVVFQIAEPARADELFRRPQASAGSVRVPDPLTVHWRLPPAYFEGSTILAVLRRLLAPET